MDMKSLMWIDPEQWSVFFERFAQQLIKFRWVTLLVLGLITGFFIYQMKFVEMDTSTENLFREGDSSLQIYNEFKEIFGNDQFVYIIFETDDFFQEDTVRLIEKLSRNLEKSVPFVEEVKCLVNVEYVEGLANEILVYELMEDFPETPDEMEIVRRKALKKPALVNYLISSDGKTSGIFLEMEVTEKDEDLNKVAPKVQDILSKPEYSTLKYHVVGMPILNYEMHRIGNQEGRQFGIFSLGLELLILLIIFRSLRGIVAPLLVVILSLIWTIGTIGLLGWKLTFVFVIIPPLIIAVGICDSVHVISEFNTLNNRLHNRREALVNALSLVGLPCLLTSLTTAIALFSFLAVDIRPIRELGVYCGFAFIFAFIISITLVPILLSFGKADTLTRTKSNGNDMYHRFLRGIGRINQKYPKWVVCIFALLTSISLFGIAQVKIEANVVKSLHKSLPIRQAIEFVDSRMGGSMSIEVIVDTGKDNGITDIKVLRQIESIQQFLDLQPMVMKTSSVISLLKELRQVFHRENSEFHTLPDTSLQIAQYLLLYEQSGGKTLDKLVSFNYSKARITAQVKQVGSTECVKMLQVLKEFVNTKIDPTLNIKYTGSMAWFATFFDYLQKGQIKSFTIALILIASMMILVLRSVKLGLISMMPNLFPVIVGLGVAGFWGIPLDFFVMLVGSIIIGIAVDDTIHFFLRYRRIFNKCGNYDNAMLGVIESVGRPIMFTSVILVVGFLVSTSSVDLGIVNFGIISAIAIFAAMIGDLFLAPSILLLTRPLGPEKQEKE